MQTASPDSAECVAIPFISFLPEGGFRISEEAKEFLSNIKTKIGVISVCGKYRTGKSYLLNKLFLEHVNKGLEAAGQQ